jgi:2-amino-4-hydroxy-6-hydroxymethyldihydropteridine diphosphokinase
VVETKSALAFIALGSNLGDRKRALEAALHSLAQARGIAVQRVSSFHETEPVGGPPGQGMFLNAAAILETTLNPFDLLRVLQNIEEQLGRVRDVRWDARTLDLDLLFYDDQILNTPELTLPHPALATRPFVLEPLAEIAPEAVDPATGRTIRELLEQLARRPT